ncbi:M15 family metallopeptidase [Demequina muriae]|uniref:M15 family metallopeptidase n=1 Tax=Demequina muriae TaxID=3051664 RepID=A0ABT8GF72_9MICO|nr:M15 family metallopeptidase [Demequina sp. EGI L300058]MDN4480082.1 M15 family metallopeptidase [Demequina sp. EGI L300058]
MSLASADVRDAAMSALGVSAAETSPSPGDVSEAAARASAAIDPITAPSQAQDVPTPRVSVSPGLDMDLHSLDDPASPWVVVNKSRAIDPLTWAPPELDSDGGAPMVPEASAALGEMRAAAADAGVPLAVGTGYRAHGFQEYLYGDYVARWGRDRADRFSARPGYSEHQTGWAVDVYGSAACRLKACFADEPAGEWVAAHGHEYGFIERYPQATEDVTGYKHEPWHLRYVGVELATEMREREIATMEEFFSLDPAPEYG